MGDMFKNFLSLGAHGRTQRAQQEYEASVQAAKADWASLDSKMALVGGKLRRLDAAASQAACALRADPASAAIGGVLPSFSQGLTQAPLVDGGSMAPGVAFGAAAGWLTSTAVAGAVGTFGTASTGAAISGLAGAAKASATLAWLGGGSLAAGGGGMVLGSLVGGALVLGPAIVVSGFFSHRRAREFEAQCKERVEDVRRQVEVRRESVLRWVAKGEQADALAEDLEKLFARYRALAERSRPDSPDAGISCWIRVLLWPFAALRRWLLRRRLAAVHRVRAQLLEHLGRAQDLWSSILPPGTGASCPEPSS